MIRIPRHVFRYEGGVENRHSFYPKLTLNVPGGLLTESVRVAVSQNWPANHIYPIPRLRKDMSLVSD